jgi:S-DNA-T family DNA segregation ATPase FtsK/SpoIIIE
MGKNPKASGAREIWAVVLVGLALLLLLSLMSYNPYDVGNVAGSSDAHVGVRNFIGPVGAWISFVAFQGLGLAAYALMVVLGVLGAMLLLGKEVPWRSKVGAGVLLLLASACLLHLAGFEKAQRALNLPDSAGGFLGLFVGGFFEKLLGAVGTAIVFLVAYLISLIILINLRPSYWVVLGVAAVKDSWQRFRAGSKPSVRSELNEKERDLRYKEFQVDREVSRKEREARKLEKEKPAEPKPEPKIEDRTIVAPASPKFTVEDDADAASPAKKDKPAPKLKLEKPEPAPAGVLASSDAGTGEDYELPPLDLLEMPPTGVARNTSTVEDLKHNAEILRQTLEEFGIDVQIAGVTKGPVVTLYEIVPAPGIKVEKIAALNNNIALAMKALTVRILAPVPGKGTVGIEVPNPKSTTVYLRDMLESEEYRTTKARIPIALGRDVAGNPITGDLAEMPHLLIAGATGSGKTVCVNAILATLMYRFRPDQLRLVLIDPKVVEMQQYNVLPHLIVPVVTESKKAPLALRWVINEMEKRYQIFAKVGVRNIASFNARPLTKPKPEPVEEVESNDAAESDEPAAQEVLKIEVPRDDEMVIPDRVPYIVVVVDELADLMLTVPADVEMAVARLTQLGRAAGIHLIIATQRPSVDVVTGVIKANIPARIGFQVASKQDSRVILDANGADKLLGKGDMLYLPPGSSKLIRAQGVLVSDEEIKRVVDFIGARAQPKWESEIHQKLQKPASQAAADEASEEDEELVEQALEVIRQTNRASVSVLQRRLRIGYTRAARIMDLLEERGIVGPNKGAEPRDILVDLTGKISAE